MKKLARWFSIVSVCYGRQLSIIVCIWRLDQGVELVRRDETGRDEMREQEMWKL
jgi:hypothetical protein